MKYTRIDVSCTTGTAHSGDASEMIARENKIACDRCHRRFDMLKSLMSD